MSTNRRPIQIVELDYPFCANDFGVAPCTAAGDAGTECYNTLRTCQDTENFSLTPLVLRFARNIESMPKGITVFPTLRSVSTRPTEINIGDQDKKKGALGRRATITVQLMDTPYHDRLTDPYVDTRDYIAMERGTFWQKFKARAPFYSGIALRVLEGYQGEALASMRTRHYIVDKIDGPDSSGRVTIRAKDILTLAEDKKALAPAASTGTFTGIDTFGLYVAGGELDDYLDESGNPSYVRVGDEIIRYYGAIYISAGDPSSGIRLSSPDRAQLGTERGDHEVGDIVQRCLTYADLRVDLAMKDLLENYTSIDTATYWDAGNEEEGATWLSLLKANGTVSTPTPVNQLLGELAQVGPILWWDEVAQSIKVRALRPGVGSEIKVVTESTDIVDATIEIMDEPDRQITQVWTTYDQINPNESPTKKSNYKRLDVRIDSDLEVQTGEPRIKRIFSRWLNNSAESSISEYTKRLLDQFQEVPVVTTFCLDAKDRDRIWTGDVIQMTSKQLTDETGLAIPILYQIISAEEVESGHKVKYKAQSIGTKDGTSGSGSTGERLCYIVDDATPDYDSASAAEKDPEGGFLSDDENDFSDGLPPYQII